MLYYGVAIMDKILKKFMPHAVKIKDAGGRLYVVGGAVRDFLLKRVPHDVDFCVTGLTVEKFMELFPKARAQGKVFPVFVVEDCEFAFARTEKKTGTGYTGFEINADPGIDIKEDLLRRDVTINAMAIDVITGELIDPYGSSYDLEYKVVRPTSEAFKEDPVRALRAARLCAELDFSMSVSLCVYINDLKPELYTINDNLKFKEFKKAMVGKAPHKFFEVLRYASVLDVTFPEFHRLDGMQQLNHNDGDALRHTYRVIEKCRELTNDPMIIIAAAYHDVGKGTTPDEILPHHHDHESRSVEIIDGLTWMPNEYKKFAKAVAYDHMRAHGYTTAKRGTKVKMLLRQNKTVRGLKGFTYVVYADRPTFETIKTIAEMHSDLSKILSISGKDMPIDTPKGAEFGRRLHERRCGLIGRKRPSKSKV
jgi:tRNA nucleotidyltransferase (CCA-adding enzyme)